MAYNADFDYDYDYDQDADYDQEADYDQDEDQDYDYDYDQDADYDDDADQDLGYDADADFDQDAAASGKVQKKKVKTKPVLVKRRPVVARRPGIPGIPAGFKGCVPRCTQYVSVPREKYVHHKQPVVYHRVTKHVSYDRVPVSRCFATRTCPTRHVRTGCQR